MDFAHALRTALDTEGMSVREAARTWNPEDSESARRTINRWLAGTIPTEVTRDSFASATGISTRLLRIPSDTTEELELLADLMAAVRRLERAQRDLLERVA